MQAASDKSQESKEVQGSLCGIRGQQDTHSQLPDVPTDGSGDDRRELWEAAVNTDQYPHVIDGGLGTLPTMQVIKIQPDAQPRIMARRGPPSTFTTT